MLLAGVGYLVFTARVVFLLDPHDARIAARPGYGTVVALYGIILAPSAAWMPLTLAMVEKPSGGVSLAVVLGLAAIGIESLGMLGALLALRPRGPAWARAAAVAGRFFFCLQAAALDAVVWTAFLPR
jgi:hypothetical protein